MRLIAAEQVAIWENVLPALFWCQAWGSYYEGSLAVPVGLWLEPVW